MEDRKRRDLVAQVRSQYALENATANVGDLIECEHYELEVREVRPVMHAGRPQAAYHGEVVSGAVRVRGWMYQDEIKRIQRLVKGAWVDIEV